MSYKIKIHFMITLLWYFISLTTIWFASIYQQELDINILQYLLLATTIFVLWSAFNFVELSHIYIIFLGMNILFLFSRIFLDIFGLYDFAQAYFPVQLYFSYATQKELLILFIMALLALHIGFLLAPKNKRTIITFSYNTFLYKIGLLLFILPIPSLLYKIYLKIKLVKLYGYTALYTLGYSMSYPWFTKGAEFIFLLGFSLLVASYPPKEKIKKVIFIYLIVGLFSALTGTRGLFVVKVVYVFWLYYNIYSAKQVKIRFIITIIAVVVLFAQIMEANRAERNVKINIGDMLSLFIAHQGTSMTVTAFMIEYKGSFVRKGYPYILHPIIATFIPNQGQSESFVKKYNSLSSDLTYFLNEKAYLNGAGLASSYIAEFYDLGYFLMFTGLILLGYFITRINGIILTKRIWLFMSPLIISQIIYMSRTNVFPRFREVLFYLFVYLFLIAVWKNYKKGNKT